MSILNNSLLLGADAAAGGYQISRSVRFNSADSAYLSRTPGSAGNRKTWTWAGWVKRSAPYSIANQSLFACNSSNDDSGTFFIYFDAANDLRITNWTVGHRVTSQVFRDFSSWYHIVVSLDTTNVTADDRIKLYVNGTQITSFQLSTNPVLNEEFAINTTGVHYIGRLATSHLSGYLADIHFIDGQALDPSSFGEFDTNGVWQPIDASGLTFGTNGFHLPFSDNSTAAALGTDNSGAGNTWTVNNISVTAGAGNDSLVDSPTNGTQTDTGVGGEVVGNYATLNPLRANSSHTLSNGNLDVSLGGAGATTTFATFGVSTGKWYWEMTCGTKASYYPSPGVNTNLSASVANQSGVDSTGYQYMANGEKFNSSVLAAYGASFTTNDVIGIALDMDAGTITFYKNGASQGQAYSGITGTAVPTVIGLSASAVFNFGQRPFAYPLSGFKALCTQNLPTGSITTSGSFTGNANADGPFVYLNGVPTAMTINGNAVTFATHADKLSNGFKLRTSSGSYNTAGSNTYSITTTGAEFKFARAQPNP